MPYTPPQPDDRRFDPRADRSTSSVEPPRVEKFTYSHSPSPITLLSHSSQPHPHQQTPILDPISERPSASDLRRPTSPFLFRPQQDATPSEPAPGVLSVKPSDKVKFLTGSEAPMPPPELVSRIEDMRERRAAPEGLLSPAATSEASYQVALTPPVRQRTPPPKIQIDLADLLTPQPVPNQATWDPAAAEDATPRLAPPVPKVPMSSPGPAGLEYNVDRPTCSLNLVCYRSGADGCVLQQVQAVLESKFKNRDAFNKAVAANPSLIDTDQKFFEELRRLYWNKMCGFWRRYFSLKTLRGFRVLSYTPVTRPTAVPLDDFVLQEMMYAYNNPKTVLTRNDWIQWIFRLRRRDKRHALEFIEGWSGHRIAIAGTIPWLTSCLVGSIWSGLGGDTQTAFTVASFILTSSTVILAILAVISSVESSGRRPMHMY